MKTCTNLINYKFDRLTVIKLIKQNKHGQYMWLCKCSCGNEKIIRGTHLTSGKIKSCGCLRKELSSKRFKNILTTHGYSRTNIYYVWQMMVQRCTNSNRPDYKYYGGRGITVCNRWLKFENFLKDVGIPENGLTLDRINNDGNYSPDNYRWSTRKEQANNRIKIYKKRKIK